MAELPIDLSWNDATVAELAAHQLTIRDAAGVFFNEPEFYAQDPSAEIDRRGVYRYRPERLMMIGPTRSGRMLSFILELPDAQQRCHVVTGWDSTPEEVEAYDLAR